MAPNYLDNVLDNRQPSSFHSPPLPPLEQAKRQQQQSRIARGGFNSSHLQNLATVNQNQTPYSISPFDPKELDSTMAPKYTERQLKVQITTLETDVKKEKRKSEDLEIQIKDLNVEKDEGFQERDKLIAALHVEIRKLKSKRSSSKFGRKVDQKVDVNKTVEKYIKHVLYRNTKFAQPGSQILDDSELKVATKKVWEGIKGRQKLDKGPDALSEDDFIEIYGSQVLKILSDCRQCVQSRCAVCIKELLDNSNGEMPTVEEFEKVWELPSEPKEVHLDNYEGDAEGYQAAMDQYNYDLAQFRKAHNLFAWYMDSWMPMAAGCDVWSAQIKGQFLLVDTFKVPMDVTGKDRVYVTVATEAFGQVMFRNCRAKWLAVWKYKKAHGQKAKPPAYVKDDLSTHVYEPLWSNCKGKRVEGGGWHLDGLEYLNERIAAVSAIRVEEASGGYGRMKLARAYIIKANGVPEARADRTRTRAEANNAAVEGAVLNKRVKLTILDE